jgi:hypothetical protein
MMSPVKVLRLEVHVSDHEPDPHASGDAVHGAHDAHAVEALGPIDWAAWAMAVLGGAVALVVAATLVIAARP